NASISSGISGTRIAAASAMPPTSSPTSITTATIGGIAQTDRQLQREPENHEGEPQDQGERQDQNNERQRQQPEYDPEQQPERQKEEPEHVDPFCSGSTGGGLQEFRRFELIGGTARIGR